MCGIGGILRTDGKPIPEEWLDAIDARIAYRGPDGAGRFRDRVEFVDEHGEQRTLEVALIHRRMAIIDHDDGGQPMISDRGRDDSEGLVAVVFNGCIYNHRELRRDLESRGHVFVTDHSDTEVLIHGWREWREELPEHLEGMYAFAVWDRVRHALAVSRDWFGEKPLYYNFHRQLRNDQHDMPQIVVIASDCASTGEIEPKDFPTPNAILPRILELGYQSPEWMMTRGLELNPGYCRWFPEPGRTRRDSRDSLIDSFMLQLGHRDSHTSLREREGSIESLFEQAVARRLQADVPLGCFLSGGVDSSLIAHFAKKHKPDLMTFSVRMPDARYDESHHAEAVAKHLGVDHHTLDVSMNPADDLVHLIEILGQPFGDSSILPTYWVSKAAREHVKVVLSGDGGDELFIGYERYMAAPFLARHWRWLRMLPVSFLHRAHPKSRSNKLARLIDMARDYPTLGVAAMEAIFTQAQIEALSALPSSSGRGAGGEGMNHESSDSPSPASLRSPPSPGGSGKYNAIRELRDFDLANYLPGDLLRKVDTASMAVVLEVRCPFLDRDLARAVLALPIEQLIPNGERKGLLRQIARKHLPRAIVDRPKMGFAVPIGEWFRTDFGGMKTLLLDHLHSAEPFGPIDLDDRAVNRLIDEHMNGQRDHSHRLFTLLTLSIWAKQVSAPSV